MARTSDPRQALDYPSLADDLWIVWASNGKPWPDANRRLAYVGKRRDAMRGYALFTINDTDAETFPTEPEARAFLAEHNAKRPAPYDGVTVSTVADMKAACGFTSPTESLTMTRLTPPHAISAAALITRATWTTDAADRRAVLNELHRRGLWLGDGQDSAAIRAGGLTPPESRDDRRIVLAAMGYCRAPVPLDARPALPVIFRADRSGDFKGTVTAVFPTLPGTSDRFTATCYAHVGQHGNCGRDWYQTTRAATPAEAADLLADLRRIYENDADPDAVRLVIVKRWTRHHDDARRAELDRVSGRAAA